jgi:bifunctional enzyme CysN/CysC
VHCGERIVTHDGNLEVAVSHRSIPVTSDELDVTRDDVTARSDQPLVVAEDFEATIIWMAEEPMLRGRGYLVRLASQAVTGTIARVKYKVSVDTLEHLAATRLETNELGRVWRGVG